MKLTDKEFQEIAKNEERWQDVNSRMTNAHRGATLIIAVLIMVGLVLATALL